MHLALDIIFNGELTPRSIAAFYSFAFRLAHGFRASSLLGAVPLRPPAAGFWRAFFGAAELPAPVLDSTDGHASARRRG